VIGRTWKLWAYLYPDHGGSLRNIGARGWVKLHGLSDPIVPVLVEEVLGDLYAPEVTHYGWEDLRYPHDAPEMIQVRCGLIPSDPRPDRALMLLDMCFAYGVKSAVEHGDGKILALRITQRPAEDA
jgi:hypothetical protein